jgi:hypothetical protein
LRFAADRAELRGRNSGKGRMLVVRGQVARPTLKNFGRAGET